MSGQYDEKLFSYGTLQLESVQLAQFGRKLTGEKVSLPGYKVGKVKITNGSVIEKSGSDIHPGLVYTGDASDLVEGVVFEVSLSEIQSADEYESADYLRQQATLDSGVNAWIYVAKNPIATS